LAGKFFELFPIERQIGQEVGMLRRTVKMMICLVVVFGWAGAPWAEDWQDGFSGIRWGTSIEKLPGWVKVGSNKKVDYYMNPEVLHTIDDVEVPHVVYGFYTGRLFAVFASIDTLEVFARMRSMLQDRFGLPRVKYGSQGEPTVYRWKENDLKIKLKTQEKTGKMKLGLYYVPLSDPLNEELEEKQRESSIRFLPIERGKTPERIPLLNF
jgi:hypothetical protein